MACATESSYAATNSVFVQPNASAPPQLRERSLFPKLSRTQLVQQLHDYTAVIKFIDGTGIRLRGSGLAIVDAELELERAARQGITRTKLDVQFTLLNGLLQTKGASIARLLSASDTALRDERRVGESRVREELPDLSAFFQLTFPKGDLSEIVSVLDQLNQFEIVEYAAPKLKAGREHNQYATYGHRSIGWQDVSVFVRAYDAQGNSSSDSNYELATMIDYADPQLTTNTIIRARHLIDVRTAINAICTYAGTSICPTPPFTGSDLVESQVQNKPVRASDFTSAQNQILFLRSSIGAFSVIFRETLTPQTTVIKTIHMEDLRVGAN